jgi:hypothetical protein
VGLATDSVLSSIVIILRRIVVDYKIYVHRKKSAWLGWL